MSDNNEPQETVESTDQQSDIPTPKDVQPEPNDQQDEQSDPAPQGTDWKAEARKWESRAKENHEELSEKEKSLNASQDEINEFKKRENVLNARIEAADELGVPVSALNGVSGDTADEITSNAKTLLSLGKRSPHVPNIGDAPKSKRSNADQFAEQIRDIL